MAVLVTVPGARQANNLARLLLRDRLAACVNIVSGVESLYWWQGKIERSAEKLLIIKSRRALFDQLCACIKKNHSCTVAEVLALPIAKGSRDYLNWMRENLKKS